MPHEVSHEVTLPEDLNDTETPVIRIFPDKTMRVLKPGGVASNQSDWVIIGDAPAVPGDVPEIEYDAQGKAFVWTTLNGVPVTRMLGPQFDNPTKAAGFRSPSAFAPSYSSYDEETTGDRVFTTNGVVTSRIPGATWAALSPQQKLEQAQTLQRQAEAASMAETAARETGAGARVAAQEAAAGERAAATEAGINARFGPDLAENARQANLQSATSAFGDVTRVAPQLGQLALNNAEFTRKVLSEAPDYLARSYFQQGQTSPLPQVNGADVQNYLRSQLQNYNTTIQGFNPQVGAYAPPPAFTGFTPPTPLKLPPPDPRFVSPGPGMLAPAQVEALNAAGVATSPTGTSAATQSAAMDVSGVPSWVPRFPGGGFTTAPMMRVGDEPSGRPNATEETVLNPTNAPLGVVPNPQTQAMKDPAMMANEAKVKAMSKLIGFVENPNTLHAMVDEMSEARSKTKPKMPSYANGTGMFGFNVPQLPMPDVANQTDIQNLERRVRPPALNTVLAGGIPQSPRFGFSLFTPQQMGALTPDDRSALGTTLATQFNETLPNVDFAIRQRFGPTGQRGRARQLAGFA